MNNVNGAIGAAVNALCNFINQEHVYFRTVQIEAMDMFYTHHYEGTPVTFNRNSGARYLRSVLHNCKWVKSNSDLEKITEMINLLNGKGDDDFHDYNYHMAVALATSLRDTGKGTLTFVSACGTSFYSVIIEQVNDFYRPTELLFYTKPPVIQIKEK